MKMLWVCEVLMGLQLDVNHEEVLIHVIKLNTIMSIGLCVFI